MKAGLLRHRIIIQRMRAVQVQDGSGDREISYIDIAHVSAAIQPVSVRDFVASRTEQFQVAVRIVIRQQRAIDTDCRIYHPAKQLYYRIVGILPDQDSGIEYMTLACESGVYTWQDNQQ